MIKKLFLSLAMLASLVLAGCSDKNEPFIGYWHQDTDTRPITLHIKPDGDNVMVRINQLIFGNYVKHNELGRVADKDVLSIADRIQVRLEDGQLIDVDNSSTRFKQITEAQYEEITNQ